MSAWPTRAGERTAFITGAASGVGTATAERLAAGGWQLALADLNLDGAQAVAARCGRKAVAFQADITGQASVDAAVSGAVEHFGGVDMCFANAGIATEGTIRHTDPEVFAVQVEVNLVGTYRTIHACLPHLIASRGYALINASSSAIAAPPGLGAYGASKAGVENLADTLRREVKHLGVDVGVVYLLFIATDMVEGAEAHGEVFKTMRASLGVLGKVKPASEAAEAIERGVEKRARRIMYPGVVRALYRGRSIVQGAIERDMLKMAPAIEEATVREAAARGERAGMRTDTAATAAAAEKVDKTK